LLFEIHGFYTDLSKYSQKNYEKSLFIWAIWLLQLNDRIPNLYNEQKKLKILDWDLDKNLKTFKDLFSVLNKSSIDPHILRNNINILNSPLRSFSIK